jgi:DNA-binding NtrC family response regulator
MLANFLVVKMHLPFLCFRISDVPLLAHQLVQSLAHRFGHSAKTSRPQENYE